LKHGVETWNAWRTTDLSKWRLRCVYPDPDLNEANLRGLDLTGARLNTNQALARGFSLLVVVEHVVGYLDFFVPSMPEPCRFDQRRLLIISRTRARRLEDLEAEFLPVASETTILRIDFVERDGTVVDHKEFTVNSPAPTSHGPRAPTAAMKALAKRLVRLEERFTPVEHDYLRDPRARHRLTITNIGKQLSLETSTCRRTLSADGSLSEIVMLDGTREGLSDADFERFIESFPVERV
jgi:hypothetical protein